MGGGSAEVEGDRDQEQDTHHPTLQVHGDTPSIIGIKGYTATGLQKIQI